MEQTVLERIVEKKPKIKLKNRSNGLTEPADLHHKIGL